MNLTFDELKEKLLVTEAFIDNEYLDKYCELIIQNKEQKSIARKTNRHHIIPQYYYKINNLKVSHSKQNLVNFYYRDHILAHYYICLCTIGKLKYGEAVAFFSLVNRKWKYEDFDPETDLSEFDKLNKLRAEFVSKNNKDRNKGYFPPQAKEKSLESRKIKIQELNDNLLFESIKDAENYYNISYIYFTPRVIQDLDGRPLTLSQSQGRLFLRLKDQPPYNKEEIEKNLNYLKLKIKEKLSSRNQKIFQYSKEGPLLKTFNSFASFNKSFNDYTLGKKFPFLTNDGCFIINNKEMSKNEIDLLLGSKLIYAYTIEELGNPIIVGNIEEVSSFCGVKKDYIRDSYNKGTVVDKKYIFSKIPLSQNELKYKFFKPRSQSYIDLYLYNDKMQFLMHFNSYLEAMNYLNKSREDIYNIVSKSERVLKNIKFNKKHKFFKGLYIFKEKL